MNRLHILIVPVLAAATLSACAPAATGGGPAPITPTSRWQLRAEPRMDRIALAVHDAGLSPTQRSALTELALRARADGASEIVVEAPSGDDPAALQTAYATSETLRASGVPVRISGYAAPHPRAPVVVGFMRLQAATYDCSREWGSLTRHASNLSPQGFGCTTASNMAAQIADPRDLLGQRPMDPADASRRTIVIEHYRRGEPTSARVDDDTAQLSDAID